MRVASAILLSAVVITTFANASSDTDSRGRALIEQAIDKTNIFALPSFRMDASVRIDNFGKPLDGTYSLLWNGPDQWREETTFPGYSEVQIGSKGVVYLKRTTDYIPYGIFQFHSVLGFGAYAGARSFFFQTQRGDKRIGKIRERKMKGTKETCVDFVTEYIVQYKDEACIDPQTGILDRSEAGITDSDVLPIGSKVFPRSISLSENGKSVIEVRISDLTLTVPHDASLFEPRPGAISESGCMNPVWGRKTKDVMPHYPYEEKENHHQGTTAIYAAINRSGVPGHFQIVRTAGSVFDEESMSAIRQWRYKPATCDGVPVEVETVITVHYTLSY